MARIMHLEEGEEFVTRISEGRPAFWRVVDGRPVMLSYAVTAFAREAHPTEPQTVEAGHSCTEPYCQICDAP